jgi:hypothetical protein
MPEQAVASLRDQVIATNSEQRCTAPPRQNIANVLLLSLTLTMQAFNVGQLSGSGRVESHVFVAGAADRDRHGRCYAVGRWYPEGAVRPAFWGAPTGTAYVPALRCVAGKWIPIGPYR